MIPCLSLMEKMYRIHRYNRRKVYPVAHSIAHQYMRARKQVLLGPK